MAFPLLEDVFHPDIQTDKLIFLHHSVSQTDQIDFPNLLNTSCNIVVHVTTDDGCLCRISFLFQQRSANFFVGIEDPGDVMNHGRAENQFF